MRPRAEDLSDEALAAVLDDIRTWRAAVAATSWQADPTVPTFSWDEIQHYLAEAARRIDPRTRPDSSPVLPVTPDGQCPVCLDPYPHLQAWKAGGSGPLTVQHITPTHHRWRPEQPTSTPA